MRNSETLDAFYKRVPGANALGLGPNNSGAGHFNVFSRDNACASVSPYSRRDFYKVSFVIGTGRLYYADKWIVLDKPALLFSNPLVPYSWEAESASQQGWFCLFTEDFIQPGERIGTLQESPLFRIGANPVFFLNEQQQEEIAAIFGKMMAEIASSYVHKYDVLRNYLHLLLHEAMRMEPTESFKKHKNASSRILSLFLELLERQFPIDNPHNSLKLRSANDFARALCVHVNHLNRAVKEITGKTTTDHISSRLIQEANALLKHTDWNVSQIAAGLGFEYPAYFTNFYKRGTGLSPVEARVSV